MRGFSGRSEKHSEVGGAGKNLPSRAPRGVRDLQSASGPHPVAYDLKGAAAAVALSERHLRRQIRLGLLHAKMVGGASGKYLISRRDLEVFADARKVTCAPPGDRWGTVPGGAPLAARLDRATFFDVLYLLRPDGQMDYFDLPLAFTDTAFEQGNSDAVEWSTS